MTTHLLLYGPPASGKKTVGTELSAITGVALIDNHMTADIGRRLFEQHSPEIERLVEELRLAVARAAAEAHKDLITTLMFDASTDQPFLARLDRVVTEHGSNLVRVQLRATTEVLLARVSDPTRANKQALRDPEQLRQQLRDRRLCERIGSGDLSVDTTGRTARSVAVEIASHVGFSVTIDQS